MLPLVFLTTLQVGSTLAVIGFNGSWETECLHSVQEVFRKSLKKEFRHEDRERKVVADPSYQRATAQHHAVLTGSHLHRV